MNSSGRLQDKVTVEGLIGYELKTMLWVDDKPKDTAEYVAEKKAELEELKDEFSDMFAHLELPDADMIKVVE